MKLRIVKLAFCLCFGVVSAAGQRAHTSAAAERQFGPVVRAYLGYLRAEQEVVDARESRREISAAYYRRNSSRIRALRQMAIQIARESKNDYLPELEAVAGDELNTLFETPPAPRAFRAGEILDNTFRFLGAVREGETFYVFARLDPYEQAELMKQHGTPAPAAPMQPTKPQTTDAATGAAHGAANTRPRKVGPP
ncbi:MAG TPA: hypothetical protein VF525_06190 [Pyrinomonadaceae bacterium]|jgi:hypothetical protein